MTICDILPTLTSLKLGMTRDTLTEKADSHLTSNIKREVRPYMEKYGDDGELTAQVPTPYKCNKVCHLLSDPS